jgi:hypothetical protein
MTMGRGRGREERREGDVYIRSDHVSDVYLFIVMVRH